MRMYLTLLRHFSLAFALTLSSLSARADKWASVTLHAEQPTDQVYAPTAKLISTKEWYFGTRWHIERSSETLRAIEATTVSFGEQWGRVYVWMSPEGTGTRIDAVITLRSGAYLHPADYGERFGKAMKKTFSGLTYQVARDKTPSVFCFGPAQISIPLTSTAVPSAQLTSSATAFASATAIVQVEAAPGNLFSSLAQLEQNREDRAEMRDFAIDAAAASSAEASFLSMANDIVGQYLATTGLGAAQQFAIAAQSVNDARDRTYSELVNPNQRSSFNKTTNGYVLALGKQMLEHANQQRAEAREANQQEHVNDLHQALDSWYTNGKDWTKIPRDIWQRLSERDQGRLKDGVDPELGLRR